jgi:MinD-like ATPase involved in chromosome partitioning or flagellar assembly
MSSTPLGGVSPPRLRLALGLGDQELEQRLRPAFDAVDDVEVVAQCLAADQLLQVVESREVDAVVVAWSLHRLSDVVLEQLDRSGLPVALLVPDPRDERWRGRRGPVMALGSDEAAIRQALQAARRGERFISLRRPQPTPEPVMLKEIDSPDGPARGIIAVAGGAGSPGRTTLAISLAAALGTAAPTVLVEADLCAPTVAAFLDRDPSRNLCTLAHAVREDPRAWASALSDELQPLSSHSPLALVLCGLPKREMRTSIAPAFLERLMAELARQYRYVVVDVGPEWSGTDIVAANHRAVLASAQQVLLVSGADLVGLWHARTALAQLERQLGIERHNVQLVLNRHDPRFHHGRSEVAWHLGAPVAAVIPFDHAAAQRALAQQRPLVVDSNGRASRAVLGLAEGVHAARLRLPVEPRERAGSDSWWRRLLPGRATVARRRPASAPGQLSVAVPRGRRGQAW